MGEDIVYRFDIRRLKYMDTRYLDAVNRLHVLAQQDGYIYAVCHLIVRDFTLPVDDMDKVNPYDRINLFETQFLLGLWMKYGFNQSYPKDILELSELVNNISEKLSSLHDCLKELSFESVDREDIQTNSGNHSFKDFFKNKYALRELLYYSPTGAFEHQYLEFAPQRYSLDQDWLKEAKNIDIDVCCEIVASCLKKRQAESQQFVYVDYYSERDAMSNGEFNIDSVDIGLLDFLRYTEIMDESITPKTIRNINVKDLCDKLFDTFCIIPNVDTPEKEAFWEHFSSDVSEACNEKFNDLSDFNSVVATPIIKIDAQRYFIPLVYILPRAIYEVPYFWICDEDKDYYNRHFQKNSGESTETLVEGLLHRVFKKDNVKRGVTIKQGKSDVSDIDVFAYEGTKAICVQVKSKKLGLKSYQGDIENVEKDYTGAVQKAYNQALKCTKALKSKEGFKFIHDEEEIKMPSKINEIFIFCVSSENFRGISMLNKILLHKSEKESYPHVMTVFDLDILTQYLPKSYLFLDYVKKRIEYEGRTNANEELAYLGYHMSQRLWEQKNYSMLYITSEFSNDIIGDYYTRKLLGDENNSNPLKIEWLDATYSLLLEEVLKIEAPEAMDIVLSLINYSMDTQKAIVKGINRCCDRTFAKRVNSNFTPVCSNITDNYTGVTVVADTTMKGTIQSLNELVEVHHYRERKNWIGLGFCEGKLRCVAYENSPWSFSPYLDILSEEIKAEKLITSSSKKVGRNDPCPCGSGKKFKKCCMNNIV